jgi:short subunit fatty acids transporter
VRRWMPDPFVLVLGLTLVALALGYLRVAGLAVDVGQASALVAAWTSGFGNAEILNDPRLKARGSRNGSSR